MKMSWSKREDVYRVCFREEVEEEGDSAVKEGQKKI